ncbi:MAG TPA: hypothetical protein VIU11_22390, partial [Nakamurella sp.]
MKAAVAAHLAQADSAFLRGRLSVAAEHGLQALDVAERAGLPAVAAVAHRFLAVTYLNAGDQARARQHTLGELGLVQRIGSPILEATATFVHLSLDLAADDWEGVLRSADEMLATGTGSAPHARWPPPWSVARTCSRTAAISRRRPGLRRRRRGRPAPVHGRRDRRRGRRSRRRRAGTGADAGG